MDIDEAGDQADRDRIITGTMFNMDWNWVVRVHIRDWMADNLGGMTPGVPVLDDDGAALAALRAAAAVPAQRPGDPRPVPGHVFVQCDAHCPARSAWFAHGLYFCAHHAREHGITDTP